MGEKTKNVITGSIFSILTFDQLKNINASVKDLLKWSSSIDIAEKYENFLQMNRTSSKERFYNCTVPWFGSLCQYKFPLNRSFSDIIDLTARSQIFGEQYSNVPCYIHIKCNSDSPSMCLDWREICNGVIDCLDGSEDEKYCMELEMNTCDVNEYQCRNGMCINEIFLLDGFSDVILGRECLDGSDETRRVSIRFGCYGNVRFGCEDIICSNPVDFNCGNGDCIDWPLPKPITSCYNRRDNIFMYTKDWHNEKVTHFPRCFKIAICATNYFGTTNFDIYCKSLCETSEDCQKQTRVDCPSVFFAPTFPVWDGHVRLGYFSNQTIFLSGGVAIPHFVCFDQNKCSFLTITLQFDNFTCLYSEKLNFSLTGNFYRTFLGCTSVHQSKNATQCSQSSMFHCLGTNKCIHKRQIMDGIPHCYGSFDELPSANSCMLNDKYRLNCTYKNVCLSPSMHYYSERECIGSKEQLEATGMVTHIEELPFSAICDGLTDMLVSSNDTDETDCDRWECVNQYTRCNGLWNCPKGTDELNCSSNFNCSFNHHPCIDPINQKMTCLHINRTENGIVDCLGATDERMLCHQLHPSDHHKRYRCWNEPKCISYDKRCKLCNQSVGMKELCEYDDYGDELGIIKYFESMHDFYLAKKAPFSPQSSRPFPGKISHLSSDKIVHSSRKSITQSVITEYLNGRQAWLCNRGILILVGQNEREECLCPPTYYGNRCQYQNQRVSLTIRLSTEDVMKLEIISIIITLVDHTGLIHSFEQLTYIPAHDCNTKFNIYLLYKNRPKDLTKKYTVHIDAYDKINLVHMTNWQLPVKFSFMPVNRMSSFLTLSSEKDCRLLCNDNVHKQSGNINIKSCRCELNQMKKGRLQQCDCSSGSICVGLVNNNRSICLCPLTRMSPHCFLPSVCEKNICFNGGLCVPNDDQDNLPKFRCVCQDGYSGKQCEEKDTQLDISFSSLSIPQSLLVHYITVYKYDHDEYPPTRVTMFKKIPLNQDTITFHMSLPFHLVFSEIDTNFYLTVLQHNSTLSAMISTQISPLQRCLHIEELLDKVIVNYSLVRRVKYYHNLCKTNPYLMCFRDSDAYMCLCTEERLANCFHFDFKMNYDCTGSNKCKNGGRCFQDHPMCPTQRMCACPECFYGTRCQFTTKQFGLSLDAILGYHIRPGVSINGQNLTVKISIVIATLMLIIALLTGTCSILTFRSKVCQGIGCGRYLLVSSITSILTIVAFNLKLWFLILSQMSVLTSRSFLLFSCISTEFILRCLLAITDWLHACVGIERLFTVILATNFNKRKSKQSAKITIVGVIFFTIVSVLHDPIHRRLIDDEEEGRTWCLVHLTSTIEIFNSFIHIFHFIIPFTFKLISAFGIIVSVAKHRASLEKKITYQTHLKEQISHHKHLIISSVLLIILALPRLIISFSFGCMKSARDPLLFLSGYFVSFIPPLLTFFIFVPTSETYRKEFSIVIRKKWKEIRQCLNY